MAAVQKGSIEPAEPLHDLFGASLDVSFLCRISDNSQQPRLNWHAGSKGNLKDGDGGLESVLVNVNESDVAALDKQSSS